MLLILFFKTHVGLCIRATGDNEDMVRASSIHVDNTKILALALSNSIIAFTGALIAQYQSFADINSGVGILVVGLASVIIGEVLIGRRTMTGSLLAVLIGSIIYRFIIAIATRYTPLPAYALKLVSACIVALALSLPTIKKLWPCGLPERRRKNVLQLKQISKTFLKGSPNEHKALQQIDLTLQEGDFVTVVGSNGAGKSTLFNVICGNFFSR